MWTYNIRMKHAGYFVPATKTFETEEEAVSYIVERKLCGASLWGNWEFEVVEIVNGKEVRHD